MSIYVQIMLVYVTATAAYAWLALWASAGKARLARMLVLWGAILLLVPIRAYDAGAFATLCAALTFVLAIAVRRVTEFATGVNRDRIASRWQFRLADLFALVLFLATYLALARECVAASSWQHLSRGTTGLALLATPVAFIAVFSFYAVVGPPRGTMAVLAALSVVTSAAMLRLGDVNSFFWDGPISGRLLHHQHFWLRLALAILVGMTLCGLFAVQSLRVSRQASIGVWRAGAGHVAAALATVLAIALVWLLWDMSWATSVSQNMLKGIALQILALTLLGAVVAGTTWAWRAGWGENVGWRRIAGRMTAAMFGLVVGLPGVWLYWQMLWLAHFPLVTYEQPNNYAQIAAFAEQFADVNQGPTETVPPQLPEIVTLLAAPNHIPLEVLEAGTRETYFRPAINLSAMRGLAEELERAAELAADEGRADDAADYALALVRLAAMLERGGTSRHAGHHWYAARKGFRLLAIDSPQPSPEKLREVIAELQCSLDARDDVATIRARDAAYDERRYGWREKLRSTLARLQTRPVSYASSYGTSRAWHEALNLQLQTELAIRLFQRDRGTAPTTLSELVPTYLSAVPRDPYDGQPLRYRAVGNRFVLYSVGDDRIDGGGYKGDVQLGLMLAP